MIAIRLATFMRKDLHKSTGIMALVDVNIRLILPKPCCPQRFDVPLPPQKAENIPVNKY